MTKCGYVALIGEPNAGKSTLLNHLLQVKLSIVTPKVQTTRRCILGIHTHDDVQVIFVDTPGIFTPKKTLEKAMVKAAWMGAKEADSLVILIDVSKKSHAFSKRLIHKALDLHKPTLLVLNKIDLLSKESLIKMTQEIAMDPRLTKVFMISALKGKGIKDLLSDLEKRMPAAPWHYGEDQLSDTSLEILVAEMTREKIFLNIHQEIPYQVTVQTEKWEDFQDGSLKISQVIHVMKKNHKHIIVGEKGSTLKRIGIQARQEIETFLQRRVHLKLFIRLTEDWIDRLDDFDVVNTREEFKLKS